MKFFCSAICFVALTTLGFAESIDPTRDYLDDLPSKGRNRFEDYKEDFVISATAELSDLSREEITKRLRQFFAATKVAGVSSCGPSVKPFSLSSILNTKLPAEVLTEDQMEGLAKCSEAYCKLKFHPPTETKEIALSKNKKEAYQKAVWDRYLAYLNHHQLKGYEGRLDNVPFMKKALGLVPFLKQRYSSEYQWMSGPFWERAGVRGPSTDCFLRQEVIQIMSKHTQPILRTLENIEFDKKNYYLNIEIHLYTNHFFDSSMRIYEVFPWPKDPKKTVFVITELLEVDELKKSALIRTLFQSQMENAIMEFRDSQMAKLRQ